MSASSQQSPTEDQKPSKTEINVVSLKHPIVILTKNPKSGWKCPYARCNHENQGLVGSLKHMWKFKSRNACNKKCIGRHQPNILQIYPKLMSKSLQDMNEYFSGEFPDYNWTAIHKLISKNSKTHQTLDFQSLMSIHQIYVHFPIMEHENFEPDIIPPHLQKYIIYDFKHFEEKYETYEEDDDDTSVISSSNSSSSLDEPPLKKQKINENIVSGLNLPELFPNAFPFQFSKYPTNKIQIKRTSSPKRRLNKKKYSIGPRCASCQTVLNPCDCMIECIECKPQTILCFNCFSNGKEFQSHKRFHRYSILEPIKLKNEHLNIRNQWNLLKSIRKFGIGNWMAISDYMKLNSNDNVNFNANRCQKYYYQYFNDEQFYNHMINDPTNINDVDDGVNNQMSDCFPVQIREKLGYKIHRNEFEAEWKNSAESMISDMYFNENDTQSERNIKIEGLNLYNNVLQQRIKRRDFIFKYGVYYGKSRKNNREIGNLENEIFNNMSSFALFAENKKEFKELINGLIDEKQLREDIYLLKKYLLNGVCNINDVKIIENFIKRQYVLKEQLEKMRVKNKLGDVECVGLSTLSAVQLSSYLFIFLFYLNTLFTNCLLLYIHKLSETLETWFHEF